MSITYCANLDRGVYGIQTGHGVPMGMVRLMMPGSSRDGELMTPEEAQRIGVEEEYLIEFRSTVSFINLCRHFMAHSPDAFRELCEREELDPEAARIQLGGE